MNGNILADRPGKTKGLLMNTKNNPENEEQSVNEEKTIKEPQTTATEESQTTEDVQPVHASQDDVVIGFNCCIRSGGDYS